MASKRKACFLGVVLVGATAVAVGVYYFNRPVIYLPPAEAFRSADDDTGQFDVTPHGVAPIAPGTVIADRPPEGWSHLILKSQPRIGDATRDQISDFYAPLTELLFTAILADVQSAEDTGGGSSYYLAKVAIGAGTDVGGRDMILSPETQEELGADLGFMQRQTLVGGLKELHRMRCVARSQTAAILDAPGVVLRRGKHREAVLRYAILVDPKTGRLDTLLWTLESAAADQPAEAVGPIQWLPPNKVVDCELHVDSSGFTLGIPNAMGFAMFELPQGRRTFALPERLNATAAMSPLTAEAAGELQTLLRSLLSRESDLP